MRISVIEKGNPEAPKLVCLPGMIGSPNDFNSICSGLEESFHFLIIDLNPQTRSEGLKGLSEKSVSELNYKESAEEISNFLAMTFPNENVYFLGLSIGAKIVYQFIADYPDKFRGGVITDMTPGPMESSELYNVVINSVESLNLSLPWSELKQDLKNKILDRNFRVLVKSQLHFPEKDGPAKWRSGMSGLKELLQRSSDEDIWSHLEKADAVLKQHSRRLLLLKAESMSGVSDEDLKRLSNFSFLETILVNSSSHFIHISNVKLIQDSLLKLS